MVVRSYNLVLPFDIATLSLILQQPDGLNPL